MTYNELRRAAIAALSVADKPNVRDVVLSIVRGGQVAEQVISDLLSYDWITPHVCDVGVGRTDWNGLCAYAPSEAVNACGFCPHCAR